MYKRATLVTPQQPTSWGITGPLPAAGRGRARDARLSLHTCLKPSQYARNFVLLLRLSQSVGMPASSLQFLNCGGSLPAVNASQ